MSTDSENLQYIADTLYDVSNSVKDIYNQSSTENVDVLRRLDDIESMLAVIKSAEIQYIQENPVAYAAYSADSLRLISGLLLAIVIVVLLKYIYRFFSIFFPNWS